MRHILALILVWPLVGLSAAEWSVLATTPIQNPPAGLDVLVKTVKADRDVNLRAVVFNSKKSVIRLVDQPNSDRRKMGQVLADEGCVAGVNGGYFHPDYVPSGLRISGGKTIHPFQKAKLLSGVLMRTKTKTQIVRSADFAPSANVIEALQAGPFLVENGKAVSGLESKKVARRTVVAADGQDQMALIVISDLTTLAEAAEILATPGLFENFKIQKALNLDGGSSSGFWVNTQPPSYLMEFKTVRDFVGILPAK